ncbi:MAG TPA: aspartate kinase [Phycisphaerales bacterium]|jgi:aspartate kinase|nr:aspartate kinase [Phycisphaerales bacterium]
MTTTPNRSTIVMKFGGTSMKDADTIKRSAAIARDSAPGKAIVCVVSAMDQVTELLLDLGDAAAGDDRAAVYSLMSQIRAKHEGAARGVGGSAPEQVKAMLDRLEHLAEGINAVGELTTRSKDAVVSFGEKLSTVMMAAALGARGFTGQEAGIVTNDHFGKAEPLMDLSLYQLKANLQPLLDKGETIVVSGFIAATQHGVTTTLGRGGSDYTACIIGAALKAEEVWIWSDVDGLMTTDPRIVPSARLLDSVTFAEAIEMGQFGAKSMHPLALEPAAEHGIPVRFRNTFNQASPGTRLVPGAPEAGADHPVKCVLLHRNAAMITVNGAAMIGRPGTAAQVFRALADAGVNVMMISQSVSEAGISLVVSKDHGERAKAVLERTLMRAGVARGVTLIDQVAVVAAVGSGMHGVPGIAARVFTAAAQKKINIVAIAQGSSELSISFVTSAEDGPEAVRALHAEFIG